MGDLSKPPSPYPRRDTALVIFVIAVLFLTGSIAFKFGWH
jgi:hypothetical protein